MHHTRTVNKEMHECIENCQECQHICQETMIHCLTKGGEHANPHHIQLLADCAEICQTSANFMSRGSDTHADICGICAEICEKCAKECEAMSDDDQMRACAEVCRRCAKACEQMNSM